MHRTGTCSIEKRKTAKKGTGHRDSYHLWWMGRKTPWHGSHSRKAQGQREESAVCPRMEQTRCMPAHVQEGTETTRASEQLRMGLPHVSSSSGLQDAGRRPAGGCCGHLATWQGSGSGKRLDPTNCGLSGWSVRNRRKAEAPFSQVGKVDRHQGGQTMSLEVRGRVDGNVQESGSIEDQKGGYGHCCPMLLRG